MFDDSTRIWSTVIGSVGVLVRVVQHVAGVRDVSATAR